MLKKLELIGFKSFADKTAFDFASGITAVVGPNGSGKSNVVDAVKWVLGEQSAKSLRGGAMADVIFNGSTTRKPFAQAEVTLTFDNAKSILATDAAEVRITRRVYRDGQGEYLINGQICRLREIKDLFLGTGAGSGAYSIIEQGRVDALLQAGHDDRRAIFEEAAGVSRYKAKKTECLRRLERVGSNLERLNDIIGSIDQQLRTVRLQAAKAQKYQEHANRLKELRLGLAVGEYRALTEQIATVEQAIGQLKSQLGEVEHQAAGRTHQARELEAAISVAESDLRQRERDLGEAKSRAAALAAALDRDRANAGQLTTELDRDRQRWATMIRGLTTLDAAATTAATEWTAAQDVCEREAATVSENGKLVQQAAVALAEFRARIEAGKVEHLDNLREAARWHNEAVGIKSQLDQLRRERDRLTNKTVQASGHLAGLDTKIAALQQAASDVQARIDATRDRMIAERARRASTLARAAECQTELGDFRAEAAGLASRIEILEAWDRGHDGLGDGIRTVLDQLHNPRLQAALAGWVADCLTVTRADAPLIDLALGPLSQFFVVRDVDELLQWVNGLPEPLAGRVGFLKATPASLDLPLPASLVGTTSAVAYVQCERDDLADLPARLLGSTFVVDDLATARALAERAPGYRFITRTGELLEADGSITLGTAPRETGVLARKSDLRELRERSATVLERMTDCDEELAALEDRVATADAELASLHREAGVLGEQHADLINRMGRIGERRSSLEQEVALSRSELSALDTEIERGDKQWRQCAVRADVAERNAAAAHDQQIQAEQAARDLERDQAQLQQAWTAAQVNLAQARERLGAAQNRLKQFTELATTRRQETVALDKQIAIINDRRAVIELAILTAEDDLNTALYARENAETCITELTSRREELRQRNRELHAEGQAAQETWQRCRDELHARELTARDLHFQRDTLSGRLAEDYQLDLAAVADDPSTLLGELSPEQARTEADDLRKKLQRLGNVNLEALEELAQIELKHQHLQTQSDDLTQARKALDEIINKINTDSKRLFIETFDTIRVHFQDLFRRLFGGGMADIVLENPDDPLETAIDIVARPPGKELRSISLMSGGERTLTAVALLLAIFRSKPSPFCILDEVDAALDEANTARLTAVLREFASTSQFIVITHAKRTMAAADVLYGITMQESGVSKRVAVRFDDWPAEERRAA